MQTPEPEPQPVSATPSSYSLFLRSNNPVGDCVALTTPEALQNVMFSAAPSSLEVAQITSRRFGVS